MENEKQKEIKESENIEMEIKEIDLPSIDVQKYIGKKVIIENVNIRKGIHGLFVKVETVILETIETKDKNIEIKGTSIFSLQEDKEGVVGWGKETKLGKFLEKHNVKIPKDLVGKEVTLQATERNGTLFLTFI